jgi:erythromycin esterase-like protein
MSGSIAAVLDYLDKVDPKAAAVARQRYGAKPELDIQFGADDATAAAELAAEGK